VSTVGMLSGLEIRSRLTAPIDFLMTGSSILDTIEALTRSVFKDCSFSIRYIAV